MTPHTVPGTLSQDIARAVASLPDVAFLKPDLAGRLRSALSRPEAAEPTGPVSSAGVRLTGPVDGTGPWRVEIQLVARGRARTVDVARAARRAAQEHLDAALPEQAVPAHVTVTVTGLV
ncbi:hypothetical protein ABZ930_01020 [Streptomyces sp. NPDC046716]|uniref:hypothetical protein n=1 Tax=Streptomyces sp. NPDC046716 TaxID=3157093 RepID=UPI0033F592E1